MDDDKRDRLIERLSGEPEPWLVPIGEFFDGNDDPGSIGCNLIEHPGVEAFRSILVGLLERPDVDAVYAEINELDPGPGSWPFTDTVHVVGAVPVATLTDLLAPLEPDDVAPATEVPDLISEQHGGPVLYAWWD